MKLSKIIQGQLEDLSEMDEMELKAYLSTPHEILKNLEVPDSMFGIEGDDLNKVSACPFIPTKEWPVSTIQGYLKVITELLKLQEGDLKAIAQTFGI